MRADDLSFPDNILMDRPTTKLPGHTHASWTVPSVPSAKAFLAASGIELSGTRSSLAVFVRDPDRTTLEFERNDGQDEPPPVFLPSHIGHRRPLDHVGIRVRAPYERHTEFYARHLGFIALVMSYEPNTEPLKNMPPWITRSDAGVDINFIINANSGGGPTDNALCGPGGVLRPGILYAAFAIAERDAMAVAGRLRAAGVDAILDTELASAPWGDLPAKAVRVLPGAPTVLLRDLDGNLLRLVMSS